MCIKTSTSHQAHMERVFNAQTKKQGYIRETTRKHSLHNKTINNGIRVCYFTVPIRPPAHN